MPQQINLAEAILESTDKELQGPAGDWIIPVLPHAGQMLLLGSDARFRVIVAHRRWGKNWVCILDALTRARALLEDESDARRLLSPKVVIWFVFPTYVLADELWRDLKRMVPEAWVTNILNSKPMQIELQHDIQIFVRSADHPDDLVGAGIDLLYMVEAARIKEAAWLTIRPTLTSLGRTGMVVFNSTPKGQNWFSRLMERCEDPLQPDWEGWRIPAFEDDLETRHPLSAIPSTERILQEKEENRDAWFRENYQAEALAGEGQVFRDVRAHVALPPLPQHPVTVGVDLAKRVDFTVFVAYDSLGRMLEMDRMQGTPYDQQGERLCGFCHRNGAEVVVIETNGPGEAFIDMFKGQLSDMDITCRIVEVATTAPSKERMIHALALAFEKAGAITLLDNPVLISELEAYEATKTPSGEKYGAPEGQHDDCVMACAMAWTEVASKAQAIPKGSIPEMGYKFAQKVPYGRAIGWDMRRRRR